jgi:hypothetical protein
MDVYEHERPSNITHRHKLNILFCRMIGHIGHITSLDYLVQITSMDYRGQSFMCGACIMADWDVLHTTVNLN